MPIKERLNRRFSNTSLVSTLSGMRVSFFLSSSVNLDGSVDISSRWQLRDISLTWPHYSTLGCLLFGLQTFLDVDCRWSLFLNSNFSFVGTFPTCFMFLVLVRSFLQLLKTGLLTPYHKEGQWKAKMRRQRLFAAIARRASITNAAVTIVHVQKLVIHELLV